MKRNKMGFRSNKDMFFLGMNGSNFKLIAIVNYPLNHTHLIRPMGRHSDQNTSISPLPIFHSPFKFHQIPNLPMFCLLPTIQQNKISKILKYFIFSQTLSIFFTTLRIPLQGKEVGPICTHLLM